MDKKEMMMKDLVEKGAIAVTFDPQDGTPNYFLLGGVDVVKGNWIMYYPAFPDGPQDLHDAVYTRFKEVSGGISFKDQYGREIHFSELEPYDKELISLHKKWKKDFEEKPIRRSSLDEALRDRRNRPSAYVGPVEEEE